MTRVPAVSLHQVTRYPSDNINTQLNIPDPPIRLHTRPAYGEEIDLAFDLMLFIVHQQDRLVFSCSLLSAELFGQQILFET